jgi:hypothetical protein
MVMENKRWKFWNYWNMLPKTKREICTGNYKNRITGNEER